ncbi:hypothetical protein [Salibacterium qingdaonense]|uniref:Uncharacterized protein n=1 Tax=Salibacterium qingdaonense TaxID=266892 RepID=A0A1I4LJK8_9BACI|nr:hypothetical protein [Salibacterium qingdaonense]SFL91140.1 hypothetical protein SAMN04488054_10812 [Salibacterium qingdaonense]
MKIEIAPHERMSETGSSLMRLIQNNELPTVDLLVRESIQNSSDAVLDDADTVNISFNINTFDPANLTLHFEGITEKLNAAYTDEAKNLEIRDTNTTGLTGPLHHSEAEDHSLGNLIHLVYEISRPQQREGAGGSWGLGKTIYFRVGIGLVVYYSRIQKEDGSFESRLAACLVEDERSDNALLPSEGDGPKRGIAWWGVAKDSRQTIPLTDEQEIENVLQGLNITPFENDETGTSIIIPFIDENTLMKSARASHTENDQRQRWWLYSMEDYVYAAVQRWYAPRINNRAYALNKPIVASVNGSMIRPEHMLSTFQAVQDLYNNSGYAHNPGNNILLDSQKIYSEKISLRNIFKNTGEAGRIVFAKVTSDELQMEPPDNQRSPYEQADTRFNDEEYNPPLISYLRKPGMIVNYDADGSWMKNIQPPSANEYIIGLFVPNSQNSLNDSLGGLSLEEYIRRGEKADHTSWNDWTVNDRNPLIVSKTKDHVSSKINQNLVEQNKEDKKSRKAGIGKAIAKAVLPPDNFGRKPTGKRREDTSGGVSDHTSKSVITFEDNPEFEQAQIHIPFTLTIGKNVNKTAVELRVMSESGNIRADSWEDEKEIGSPFPIVLNQLEIDNISVNEYDAKVNVVFHKDTGYLEMDHVDLYEMKSNRYNVTNGVKLIKNTAENSCTIKGRVTFETIQGDIQGSISTVDEAGGKE